MVERTLTRLELDTGPSGDLPDDRLAALPVSAHSFSFSGTVDSDHDPADWLFYQAPVHGLLTFELIPKDGPLVFDLHWDGEPFAKNTIGGTAAPASQSYWLSGGETFHVQIRPWSSDGGRYEFNVIFEAAADVTGNTFEDALYQFTQFSWWENVGFGDDTADVFRFEPYDTGMHRVSLSGLLQNLDVYVYDDRGRLIAEGTAAGAADEDFLFPGIDGKNYYIQVVPVDGSLSNYDLSVEKTYAKVDHGLVPVDHHDNFFDEATPASDPGVWSDAVGFDGDRGDYYVIQTDNQGVRLNAVLSGLSEDLDIVLYNSAHFDLRAPYWGGAADETITYDLEPFSTYYIAVLPGGLGDTRSTYDLSLNLEPFDADDNGDFDSATPVGAPIVIEDSVGFAGDEADYFRFEAPASGVLRVALTDLDDDLDLWVFGPDTFPAVESLAAGTIDEYASVQVSAGETYWVRVNPALEDENASPYRLSLDFRGGGDRAGDTLETAAPVPLPSRQLDSVGFGDDAQDLFRVTLPVNGTIDIALTHISADLDLHVFDAAGRRMGSARTAGLDEEALSLSGSVGETYYIGVVPADGGASPYRLTLGFEDARLIGLGLPNDPLFEDQWHLLNLGQRGGTGGIDLNVVGVWADYTGRGVNVGIYDNGVETDHPDLAGNYNPDLHLDAVGGTQDPYNAGFFSGHGTAVAGIVGAVANNGIGVTGIAYNANITAAWVIDSPPPGLTLADALGQMDRFDVVNHSWGFIFDFIDSLDSPAFTTFFANLERTATGGRDGLGTIMVVAAGNGRFAESSSNYSNFANSPFVITIAAMDDTGAVASYSSPGANILVSAPAGNFFNPDRDTITTTDTTGPDGFSSAILGSDPDGSGDYTRGMNGTSAATPMVTGTVALMLEANPNLHWTEVHTILALSARQTGGSGAFEKFQWMTNGARTWNGGGMHFSNDYGFGRVDAQAAVRLAETWHGAIAPADEMDRVTISQSFSAGSGQMINGEMVIPFTQLTALTLTRVEVTIELTGDGLDQTSVFLRSPSGTESLLFDGTGTFFLSFSGTDRFTFTSNTFRGEDSAGTWEIVLRTPDRSVPDSLDTVTVTFAGQDSADPDDRYVFTDEFGALVTAEPERAVLDDWDGGINVLNLAAVTADVSLDLSARTAVIGSHDLDWTARTVFADVILGDGDDVVTGSDDADIIHPGRGDDRVTTGEGADMVRLGPSPGENTITDFEPSEGDRLDLSHILDHAGYAGGDAIADGWVAVTTDDNDTVVQADRDGPGQAYTLTPVARLTGRTQDELGPVEDWLIT